MFKWKDEYFGLLYKRIYMSEQVIKNSHIQLTRGLMNPFSMRRSKDGKFYYTVFTLDLTFFNIECKDIEKINTEEYFYNQQIEEALSKRIEKPFGAVRKKIVDEPTIKRLSFKEVNDVNRFAEYCCLRSKDKLVGNLSKLKKLFPNQNFTVSSLIKEYEPCGVFSYNDLYIFNNKTDNDFILTSSCINEIMIGGNKIFFLSVSPKAAIGLIKSTSQSKRINQSTITSIHNIIFSYTKDIDNLNQAIFKSEYKKSGFVIAHLESTLNFICENNKLLAKKAKGEA